MYRFTQVYSKSIMHYHFNAHALNKSIPTIIAIRAPFDIETNENLSDIDVQEIRTLYNCKPGISTLSQKIDK